MNGLHENPQGASSVFIKEQEDTLGEKKKKGKTFKHRESEITLLFQNPHLKTIHHIAIAFFSLLSIKVFIEDYTGNKNKYSVLRLIFLALEGLHMSILMWIFIYISVCCTYLGFLIWTKIRAFFIPKSTATKLCDILACLTLLSYYISSFVFISHFLMILKLPIGSASFIMVEQVRLLMKVHAFVRSNVTKILKSDEGTEKTRLPTFGHFIYFTWIPTLVYSDEYPRTARTNWCKVTEYFLEILAVIVLYAIVFQRLLIPLYENFGRRGYSTFEIFLTFLGTSIPGGILLTTSFYLVLHLLQNLFAEMLCFGDRLFYRDWWTVTDVSTFFRKWNIVVQDWLYNYVYREFHENLFPGRRNVAKYMTFLLSVVVHEWMMSIIFGYFLPIMTCLFIIPAAFLTPLRFPKYPIFNIVFWILFLLGTGTLAAFYLFEFFARFNGVPGSKGRLDFFIPRSLTCDYCYSR